MSKFGSKEDILSAIQSLFDNIQSGRLSADEMESLVELTRELHERSLILRYKSYEEKIFGTQPETFETILEKTSAQETKPAVTPETVVEITPEPTLIPEPTPVVEEEEIIEEAHSIGFEQVEEEILLAEAAPIQENPVFDFDMFEKAEEEIFTPEIAEEKIEETIIPEVTIVPEISETIETSETKPTEVEEVQPAPQISFEEPAAPVVQEIAKEEIPLPEELAIMNEPVIVPEPEPRYEEQPDIFRKSTRSDDSLSSRLMSSKLETLVGAFGLNEKLQCIRELFKGSSEAFNQAIETLDQQESFANAKRVLAQYAQQNSWDLESNLTAEFIQKVERRFL